MSGRPAGHALVTQRRQPRGGFTLVEAMACAAVLLVIGLVMAYLFKNATTVCGAGWHDVDARSNARLALKRMKDELAQSVRVDHRIPLGSPVVRPSMAASGSYNDLMFFVLAVDLASVDRSDLASYRLVRYYVPAASTNRLRRAVYAVTPGTFSGTPLSYAATEASPESSTGTPLLYSPMALPSIAPTQGVHWFVNTGAIPAATFGATTPPYEEDIVTLNGSSDIVAFTVTHGAGATPARKRFHANDDRLTFRIEVQVIRYISIDSQTPARTTGAVRIFSETVRVPDPAL